MSGPHSLSTLEPTGFEVIEAAVAETARGRWFLAEYARRNRNADTEMLLGAIGKLENAVSGERAPEGFGRLRGDLMEMVGAIARTKAEMAAIGAPNQDQSRLGVASEALDAIVRATERATSDILGAAEEVQEAAWTLRESGADSAICDELDQRATQIYTACSFQDLTAQRTGRIVHTLRYLEERLIAMIAIWGDDETPPAPPGARAASAIDPVLDDLCQSDVDRYIDMDAQPAPAPAPEPASLSLHEDLVFVESAAEAGPAAEDSAAGVLAEPEALDWADETPAESLHEEVVAAPEPVAEEGVDAEEDGFASMLSDEAAAEEGHDAFAEPEATTVIASSEEPLSRLAAEAMPEFADLDALTLEEKLALFT